MVAPVVREHGFGAVADDMEFLVRAEPEPRSRKRELRTRNCLEPQHAPVKLATLLDITDVNRDVVQFLNLHLEYRGRENRRVKKTTDEHGWTQIFGASSRSTVRQKGHQSFSSGLLCPEVFVACANFVTRQRLGRSAGFQTCCIADFQIGGGVRRGAVGGFGNPRYSRLGSLRYFGCGRWPR